MRLAAPFALTAGLAVAWAGLATASGTSDAASIGPDELDLDAPGVEAPEPIARAPARPGLVGRQATGAGATRPIDSAPSEEATRPALALRVEVVDAESGRPLPRAGWRTFSIEDVDAVPSFRPGEDARAGVIVDRVPEGYVVWDALVVSESVSRYATSLRAVQPLRPETPVTVEVREWTGDLRWGASVGGGSVAGRYVPRPSFAEEACGLLRLRGVPFLRDEPLTLYVAVADDDGAARSVEWRGMIPDDLHEAVHASVTLPPPEPTADFEGPANNGVICCGGSG